MNMQLSFSFRTLWLVLASLLSNVFSAGFVNALEIQQGQLTPMTSQIGGIISNRHQEHMWVTPDGGVHVLIAGSEESSKGLRIFSSYDNGTSWVEMLAVSATEPRPKADGFLDNDVLNIVYVNADGELILVQLLYDEFTMQWLWQGSHTIFSRNENFSPNRSTVAVDTEGMPWVATTEFNERTEESTIKVGYLDEFSQPQDSGKRLGTRNTGQKKSARVLSLSNGVVVVYTDTPDMFSFSYTLNWAYRLNSWPNDVWADGFMYQYSAADGLSDRYGAHFSAAVDSKDNVHVVTRSDDKVIYFRISDYTLVDPIPKILGNGNPYTQVSIADDDAVYVSFADTAKGFSDIVWLLKSTNGGEDFELSSSLIYRPKKDLGKARIEVPAHVDSSLPVLRQITHPDGLNGLVSFSVPTAGEP